MDEIKPIIPATKLPVAANEQSTAALFRIPNLPSMEAVGNVKALAPALNLNAMKLDVPLAGTGHAVMEQYRAGSPIAAQALPSKPQQGTPVTHAAQPSDGFVRMEIHSENGTLSIVGAHPVDGPLALATSVAHGLVYEATIDNQQVALGSLPDASISRAFANSTVPDYHAKHRVTQRTSYNFFIRIPRAQLTAANLPKLNIVLHNVTDSPATLSPGVPLSQQTGVQHTEVARIPGINLELLAPAVKPLVQQMIR